MYSNDLSNRVAPTLGLRVEDSLVTIIPPTTLDKVKTFVGLDTNYLYEFDEDLLKIVSFVFRHTNMTMDLYLHDAHRKNKVLIELLDAHAPGRIVFFNKPVEIARRLYTGDLLYYSDSKAERRSQVGHKSVITPSEMYDLIRRFR